MTSEEASDAIGDQLAVRRRLTRSDHGNRHLGVRGEIAHRKKQGGIVGWFSKQAGLVESTSEALRLIAQRGIKMDGDVVADKALVVAAGQTVVLQAGKRKFVRVTLN